MKENIRILLHQSFPRQRTIRFVPLINPVDHPDQRQGGGARRDRRGRVALALDVGDEMLDKVQVIFLASVNLAAARGRQLMILVQHDRNFTVFRTEHDLNVKPDQRAQALFRHVNAGYINLGSVDAPHHIDHLFLGDVHGVRHDVKQNLVFRLKVMIEATLGELERGGDIVHRSGVIALLLKEARSGAQDFLARLLPRFDGSFPKHHTRWYRGTAFGLYPQQTCDTRSRYGFPSLSAGLGRHGIQKFHVGTHRPINALHLRIGRVNQVILIGRVGAFAMSQSEMASGQAQGIAGEDVAGPRSWTARQNDRIDYGTSIYLYFGFDDSGVGGGAVGIVAARHIDLYVAKSLLSEVRLQGRQSFGCGHVGHEAQIHFRDRTVWKNCLSARPGVSPNQALDIDGRTRH